MMRFSCVTLFCTAFVALQEVMTERIPNNRIFIVFENIISLFIVDAFYLENDRARAVVAAGDHCVLVAHPAPHYRAPLQTRIDITRYGVPGLGTERLLRPSGNLIGISLSPDESVQSAMPVVIALIIAKENEFISFVIDRTFARTRIGAILPLVFGIELRVKHRDFNFVFHRQNSSSSKFL